jgi:hypothetical protein
MGGDATKPAMDRHAAVLAQLAVELSRLGDAAAAAGQRHRELDATASSVGARLQRLEAELQSFQENAAQQLLGGGGLDLAEVRRYLQERDALQLELRVRLRAVALALAQRQSAEGSLAAARAAQVRAMTTRVRRIV